MKKSAFLLIALLSIFLESCTQNKLDAATVLKKSFESLSIHNSVRYTARYTFKRLGSNDTMTYNSNCQILKVPADTFFHSRLKISIKEFGDNYTLYAYPFIYSVEKDSQKVTRYDAAKGETWAITSNMYGSAIWTYFTKPQVLFSDTADGGTITLLPDTIMFGQSCYHIAVKTPDDGDFTDMHGAIFITKKDLIPIIAQNVVKFQGDYQYSERYIGSYKFDDVDTSAFSDKQIPKTYKSKIYKTVTIEPLPAGAKAPKITGRNYNNNMKTETVDFNGKVTLLDFWYMSCFPCIKAIAQIEKLTAKYPTLQVIGINSSDTSAERIDKLKSFREQNKMTYPIFITTPDVADMYRVQAYPTLYLVDREGNVMYTQSGIEELDGTLTKLDSCLHAYMGSHK